MLSLFQQGMDAVFTFQIFGLVLFGTIVGIIFGAIPGLTSTMAVALFLPITYTLGAAAGISLLVALFIGGTSGGLISAILLKIPGTPSSVATVFDGGPMMEKGEGAKALGVGIVFSFLGTILSIVALIFIAPTLAKIALSFGPHEYFSIAIFSLTLIISLATGSMLKGLFSGIVGFAFSTVGIAPVDAITRFTFGQTALNGGFEILTVLIGLFAMLPHDDEGQPGNSRGIASQVMFWLDEHYQQKFSLDALADELGKSRSYVSRKFHAETGEKIHDYLNTLRLRKACESLLHSDASVRDIAARVGFSDVTYFISAFKKGIGETPLQYRKNHGAA